MDKENAKIQRELDEIMLKNTVIEEGKRLFADKWVERGVLAFLGLIGVAIVMKFLSLLSL